MTVQTTSVIFETNFTSMEDSLTYGVDRSMLLSVFLCILYLLLMVLSIVSNGSVIISAIFERWKEVDNFTFVIFVSLAFNQLLIGFLIFPMISYSMVAHKWGLGVLFCWWCALLSTYLYTVYIVHAVVLMFDMIIVRYSDLRTTISVSVSKRIALNTWAICGIPQIYPLIKLETPYFYDPIRGGCYQSFLFSDTVTFFKTVGIFLVLPLSMVSISYFVLLVKEENNRRLTATILKKHTLGDKELTITRNYITPMIAVSIFLLTVLPFAIVGFVKLGLPPQDKVTLSRTVGEFVSTWVCFGGILLPLLYFLAVKTYRVCIMPNLKWDVHIAAITKLRRKKNCNSPCVRRQGVVMYNVPMMSITEEADHEPNSNEADHEPNSNEPRGGGGGDSHGSSNGTLNATLSPSPPPDFALKSVTRELSEPGVGNGRNNYLSVG